jgi:hypothetical protein
MRAPLTIAQAPAGAGQPHESEDGDAGSDECDRAGDEIGNAFENEGAPALVPARGRDCRSDGKNAVEQHVDGEEQHQGGDGGAGQQQRHDPKGERHEPTQRHRPPVSRQESAARLARRQALDIEEHVAIGARLQSLVGGIPCGRSVVGPHFLSLPVVAFERTAAAADRSGAAAMRALRRARGSVKLGRATRHKVARP